MARDVTEVAGCAELEAFIKPVICSFKPAILRSGGRYGRLLLLGAEAGGKVRGGLDGRRGSSGRFRTDVLFGG